MSDITTNPKIHRISIIQEIDSDSENESFKSEDGPDFGFGKNVNVEKNFTIDEDNLSIKKVDTPPILKESASDFQYTRNAIEIDNKIKSISFDKEFKNPSEAFNSLNSLIKKESVNSNINKGNNSV